MRYNLNCFRNAWIVLSLLFLDNTVSNCQTLTLYSFPPPHPYNWNNPHSLLTSTVRNYFSKKSNVPRRILGHMVIELKKDTSVFFSGIVSDDISNLKNLLLKKKIGLGVLFKLVKGHMEETSRVQAELKMRTSVSEAAFISFKINDSAYNYLLAFIDSFKLKGYDTLYNGLNMPRAGKGSGCTAFGMSFLELINALVPEYSDKWAVHVNVPEKLVADELSEKKIGVLRILFTFRWAKENEPYRKLMLYDPFLIYSWINDVWEREKGKPVTKYQFLQTGTAKGLLVDCTNCSPVSPMFSR